MTNIKKGCLHFNAIQRFLISCKTRRGEVKSHGLDSEYWDVDMLRAQFRFNRSEFRHLMSAMHLTYTFILLGRKGSGSIVSN